MAVLLHLHTIKAFSALQCNYALHLATVNMKRVSDRMGDTRHSEGDS